MKPSSAPIVYVAGPLTTHGDVQANRARAVAAGRMLAQNGFTPIVPHFFLELDEPVLPYEFWMGACLALLAKSDMAFFLQKWQASKGAQIEHAFCLEHGIPIVYMSEEEQSSQEALEQS